jgi:DNA-binding NtrC family response regulator
MSTSRDSSRPRVLYLDASGPAAERLCATLSAAGLQPELTCDLEAARQELAGDSSIELVLAEATQGGAGLLDHAGDAPVLVIDSFGTVEDAAALRTRGAAEVLARPLTPDALLAACQRALELSRVEREMRDLRGERTFGNLSSRDARMCTVLELAERVADSRAGLLLQGESGTGKTRLARAVHAASARAAAPFVEVNCGAMPTDLLMSELFGHVRGAFTGAEADRIGKFEAADGGTLFLDEIASASLDMQVKLLRVLESGRFERVGDNRTIEVDVRVLAACNQDLERAIEDGDFRADLYWRLNVVSIELPPLRDRPGDLVDLAESFRARFADLYRRELAPLDAVAQGILLAHEWPGNVRELENAIERAVLFSRGSALAPEDFGPLFSNWHSGSLPSAEMHGLPIELLPLVDAPPGPLKAALAIPERFLIRRALEAHQGNRNRCARALDINRSTLFNKMRKHGLSDFPMHTDSPTAPPARPDDLAKGSR